MGNNCTSHSGPSKQRPGELETLALMFWSHPCDHSSGVINLLPSLMQSSSLMLCLGGEWHFVERPSNDMSTLLITKADQEVTHSRGHFLHSKATDRTVVHNHFLEGRGLYESPTGLEFAMETSLAFNSQQSS